MTKLKERIYAATDYSEVGGRIEAQGLRTRKERMEALKGKTWHIVARNIRPGTSVIDGPNLIWRAKCIHIVKFSFTCVEISAARAVCRIERTEVGKTDGVWTERQVRTESGGGALLRTEDSISSIHHF